ncbi:MAG: SSS sodium solute transporter [Candidatus Hydrogenedentota bacterium]
METPSAQAVATGLASIDYAIIIFYMLGVLAIGTYFGRYVKTAGDLFLAGKSLPFWAIGMSIVVSDIGATDFLAVGGAAYRYGISAANFDWIGSMPAMVIAAFLFVPYYWRSGVYTVPEFLGKRYNVVVQMLHAAIWGVFMLVMLGVMLKLTAAMLNETIGLPTQVGIWMIVVIVGVYTFSGGLTAVVMTDVIQMIVMFVGGLAMSFLCIWEVGGWGALQEKVIAAGHDKHFTILLENNDPTAPYPWSGIVFGLGLVLATSYMAGNQAVIQRCFGARSEWDAKGGMLFGGFLKSFIPLMVALPGLSAIVLVPNVSDADLAVPAMIRDVLPPGLTGLMFAALFAALMSSVDSYLNSASTIWTTDLYGRFRHMTTGHFPTEQHALVVGRAFTAAFILSAAFLAPYINTEGGVYNFIQTCLTMFQGPVFAILLLGIMWKRTTQWGGLAGLVLGVACTTVLNNTKGLFPSADPFLYVAWWSFLFSLAVTVLVSLVTPPEPDEKLRGLIFGQVMKDGKIQRVLLERVK